MLYIFDKDDNFINVITEDTGLIDTWFKDYQNHLIDEPFVFHVDSESELLPLIVAENQVAFKHTFHTLQVDLESFKLMRIKEVEELYSADGYIVRVSCEPSWLELYDHFIEDKRINNGTAQTAMDRALEGSRWIGADAILTGNGSTNFYWIDAVEALFKIAEEWNGTLQDYITLDENNEIALRIMYLLPRLGRDNGLLIQPDYNAETIERRTLSYPITAMYGQGASLETDNGGHTRYITFEDVEWKVSDGDPVDKPLGQKWVGDPDTLAKYGYLKEDGSRMHRFGHFSNQDYETPEELLHATWQALQENKEPEIYHEATIHEVDKPIYLGDTGTILDRHYGKPIEVQSQITGLEYDILKPMENVNIVLGNYKDMSRDPLEDEIDEIKQNQKRPAIVDKGSFPNKKPMKPTNVEAVGGWETIQLTWTYTDEIYVSHYEVYASQNKDFVPDSQFLVYSGKVSAFGHEVKTDEVWYYRVCAVNYHDERSPFSDEATAMTVRIPIEVTEFENIILDAKNTADEAFDNANIAGSNAQQAINDAQAGFNKALEAMGKADANEQSIITINTDYGKLYSRVESVNTRIDELDGDDRNLITHLPQNWESGYINNATGGHVSNNTTLRTIDYYEIKPNEEYILQTYGNYEIVLVQFDSSKNALGQSNAINAGKSFGDVVFTSHNDARYYRVYFRRLNDPYETLDPSMVGTTLKAKLSKGSSYTEWTPNFNDTGELVNNVQQFVSEFEQTADSLASRITDNEGNIASNVLAINGMQTTISSVQGDLNVVTNLANVNQQQLSNLDGDVNTLTQTVNATISRIENMSGNMITHNPEGWLKVFDFIAIEGGVPVKQNTDYILTDFSDEEVDNIQVNFGGKSIDISEDGTLIFNSGDDNSIGIIVSTNDSDFLEKLGTVYRFKLEEGTESTAWTAHDKDTYTQYSQLQDAINLRVKEGDLLSQINIEADRILIDTTGKLVLNAESTLISNAVIKNAHIESLSGQKIISKSITTDQLDVNNLSAITANLGTVRSGRLLSQNNNMELNLNTGTLNMQNADFTLGGGANIEFTSSSNKMTYSLYDSNSGFSRVAGFGVGNALGGRYPFAHMGTTGAGEMDTLSRFYSGFIANTTARISEGGANSVSGYRFQLRNEAVDWTKGMVFDWFGDNPSINVFSPATYDYTLGTFYKILGKQNFNIQNYFNNRSGWILQTNYAGDGSAITFRGQYGGEYNYQIGGASSNNRIQNIYLSRAPNVSSDERLKENIQDLELGLDFINRINPISYSLKTTNADKTQGTVKNVTQYGISAQQVLSVLDDFNITNQSLITGTDEEMYGASYEQFIAPMINAIKELTSMTEAQQTIIDDLLLKVANLEGIA